MPVDDAAFKASKGFKRKASTATFRGTYSQARKKGASLTYRVSGASSLVLVVSTGKRYGKVDVFLGKRKLRTVSTKGTARTQVLVPVSLGGATSGKVKIRTKNGKQVRIDGLAVLSSAPPAHLLRAGSQL